MEPDDAPNEGALRAALAASRKDPDGPARWDHIRSIEADEEVFVEACGLCASESPVERRLGCDLLAHVLSEYEDFRPRGLATLRPLVDDPDDQVVMSAVTALGHAEPDDIAFLERFVTHESSELRFAVALAINTHTSDKAVAMLVEFSRDADDDVRNWATFGLGTQRDRNDEVIRNALAARLDDPHDEVREEALVGLARRKDERVIEPLRKALSGKTVAELSVEAAKELASPELLPALQKLLSWWPGDEELLVAAIALSSRVKSDATD